jgi:hypothetical protein
MFKTSNPRDRGSTVRAIIVGALIALGLLCFSALPNFVHRQSSPKNACIKNLILLDSAKRQWALEHRATDADTPTWDDIKSSLARVGLDLPTCPSGGTYTLGAMSNRPTCSIPDHVLP